MVCTTELQIALKEWASVCSALEQAKQIVLLRKGGIHEAAGEFELENPQFLLFPTYLHQNLKSLKPSEHAGFAAVTAEPARVDISAMGVVTDILQLQSRAQIDAIDDQHIWTGSLIDMRFNYRPENPLYLLLVRTYRLPRPVSLENTPAYGGCKSWVPLERAIDTGGAQAVLDEEAYEARRRLIRQRMG